MWLENNVFLGIVTADTFSNFNIFQNLILFLQLYCNENLTSKP